MIIKYYIISLMVINTMEKSKQLSAGRNAESKVRCYFNGGSGYNYVSDLFEQKPESSRRLSYRLPRGKTVLGSSQQAQEP